MCKKGQLRRRRDRYVCSYTNQRLVVRWPVIGLHWVLLLSLTACWEGEDSPVSGRTDWQEPDTTAALEDTDTTDSSVFDSLPSEVIDTVGHVPDVAVLKTPYCMPDPNVCQFAPNTDPAIRSACGKKECVLNSTPQRCGMVDCRAMSDGMCSEYNECPTSVGHGSMVILPRTGTWLDDHPGGVPFFEYMIPPVEQIGGGPIQRLLSRWTLFQPTASSLQSLITIPLEAPHLTSLVSDTYSSLDVGDLTAPFSYDKFDAHVNWHGTPGRILFPNANSGSLVIFGCDSDSQIVPKQPCLSVPFVQGAGMYMNFGPIVLRWIAPNGKVIGEKAIGTGLGQVGADDKVRKIEGGAVAYSPDGSIFIVMQEGTEQPATESAATPPSFFAKGAYRLFHPDGPIFRWQRTRLVKVSPNFGKGYQEWILESRTAGATGCNDDPKLGIKNCGLRARGLYVVDNSTIILRQIALQHGLVNKNGDVLEYAVSVRFVKHDLKTGSAVSSASILYGSESSFDEQFDSPNYDPSPVFRIRNQDWSPSAKTKPLIGFSTFQFPSTDKAFGLRFLELDVVSMKVAIRTAESPNRPEAAPSNPEPAYPDPLEDKFWERWTSYWHFWPNWGPRPSALRLHDGGVLLSVFGGRSIAPDVGKRGFGVAFRTGSNWLFRYSHELKLLWSRPLGTPIVTTGKYGDCQKYIDGNIQRFVPLFERKDGSIVGTALLRASECAGPPKNFWDVAEAIMTLSPWGDLDCSSTPDLCQGKNVLSDCSDGDLSTFDDCQHSIGCYQLPWSFLKGLKSAEEFGDCVEP